MKNKTCIKTRFCFLFFFVFMFYLLLSCNLSLNFVNKFWHMPYAGFYFFCHLVCIQKHGLFCPPRLLFDSLPLLQFNDLQECYLQKRRHAADRPHSQQVRDINLISREGYTAGLEDFQSVLTTFTRYRYSCLSFSVISNIHSNIFRTWGYFPGRMNGCQISQELLDCMRRFNQMNRGK